MSAQAQLSNASGLQEKAKWHHPQMWLKKAWFVGASVILSAEFKNPKTYMSLVNTCEIIVNCEISEALKLSENQSQGKASGI